MCYVSDAIYPPEFSVKPDLVKAVWFKYMLVDEACKSNPPVPGWRISHIAKPHDCTARVAPPRRLSSHVSLFRFPFGPLLPGLRSC